MKKYIMAGFLLVCMLSMSISPVMAAQDTIGDRVITPKAMASEQLQEHISSKIAEQAKSHNPSLFTNEVPGVGGLKYEGEQVPKGFEYIPETVTMVSWHNEGRLHIRDTEHKTVTIQIPWSTLQDIEGFDGEHVRIWHYNDEGVCDGKWIQTVANEGGFAYLEEVPFSEVVVGGFTGTYAKIDNEIDITDTINLGRTFDSDDVSSVSLTIDDQYSTKTDPYDIDTTGLVFWGRFDDAGSNVIDYSGNGNNGTFTAATYTEGKYNNGGEFDGVDNKVQISYSEDFNTPAITYISWINLTSIDTSDHIYSHQMFNASDRVGAKLIVDASNKLVLLYGDGTESSSFTSNSAISTSDMFFIAFSIESETSETIYINGNVDKHDTAGKYSVSDTNLYLFSNEGGNSNYIAGMNDEVLIYNRSLSVEELDEIYYLKLLELQAKTNSHAEYSGEWNSSADNPLSVPFGESESISSLTFAQPESIEQNGITIYNPVNVLFNATATIGYTEDSYLIEEFCDEGFYIDQYAVEISHTPSASNANGEISYNPTDSLCSDIMGKSWTYELDSNNPAAVIKTFNANSLVIDTGAITAGTEYSYVVTAEANHIYNDGLTATQQGASMWGSGVAILNVAFMVSIIAAGLVALRNANDPEKSAKPAVQTLVALSIGLLVFTVIVTLGAGIGSAIETLLGV